MLRGFRFAAAGLLAAATVSASLAQPPAAAEPQSPAVDAATRRAVVEALAEKIEARYVYAEKGQAMAAALRAKLAGKAYDAITAGPALARRLTADLRAVTDDRHIRVTCSPEPLPEPKERADEPTPKEMKRFLDFARYRNGALQKVERLPGNVGYLELRNFMPPEAVGKPLAAAMNFLANTDALILDLRRNGGGAPGGVQLVCSYLFPPEPSIHLNSLYFRPRDQTDEFWTLKDLPGRRFVDKPVYVLTSKFTFSGAEECAYNLQTRKRATIVGETTGGGAHPGGRVWLAEHFAVFIPTGRAINPVTNTNWEGTGVKPDVAADAALDAAHDLALKAVRDSITDPERQRLLDDDLEAEKAARKRYEERKSARAG
jgi:C-terminal processing protease CtpA/Prc